MTIERETNAFVGVDSFSIRVLQAIVRLIMLPILIIGFAVWGIAIVGSMAISSAIEGMTYTVRALRTHRMVAFPTRGNLSRDIDLRRPELVDQPPLG